MEGIGYDEQGQLCHCDGFEVKPISLAESVKWLAEVELISSRTGCDPVQPGEAGRIRWLREVAEHFPN